MNIIFLYTDDKPKRGQFRSDNLPNLSYAIQPIRSILLLQRSPSISSTFSTFDILNNISNISSHGLLKWCQSHRIDYHNQHIVRYEPRFSNTEGRNFINVMRIYECKAQDFGDAVNGECSERLRLERKCIAMVALWTKGL